jgi:thiol-disulfide isomerase/thioredoxin
MEWTNTEQSPTRPPQQPRLVLYHWNKCGHCISFQPEWNQLANGNQRGIEFVEMEADVINALNKKFGANTFADTMYEMDGTVTSKQKIRGFPELRLYLPNGSVYHYTGERTAAAISNWLSQKVSSMSALQYNRRWSSSMSSQFRRGRRRSSSSIYNSRRSSSTLSRKRSKSGGRRKRRNSNRNYS